jgi:cytochrome P450
MSRAPRIDVSSDAFKRDPFPTFAKLQAEGPIVRARIPLIGEVWLVNTHEAVGRVLKDAQHFVVDARNAGRGRFDAFPIPLPRSLKRLANNMLGHDDPDHRRLRNLVERAFRRRNVDEMHERIGALADELLGRVASRATSGEAVDLVEEFARRLPMGVISELLGLPETDRPLIEGWAKGLASAGSVVAILRTMPGLRKLGRYFEEQIEQARREGGEGLLPALVQAEHEGERLSEDELISMIFLLMLAGFETTTNLIAGGVLALLQHPADREKLFAAGDAAMAPAVEELLRFVTPVQMTKPRYAVEDVEVAGTRVQRG